MFLMFNKIWDFFSENNKSWEIFQNYGTKIIADKKIKDKEINKNIQTLNFKTKIYKMLKKNHFFFIDFFFVILYQFLFFINSVNLKTRLLFRLESTDNNFYKINKDKFNFSFKGLNYIMLALKYWIVVLFFLSISVYYMLILKLNFFSKTIFVWVSLLMFFYWLVSGFVFFFKKYQFGKYTTAIQRFWRRSYIIFWILEAYLFLIFFYLTINASAESFYMFDQIQIYKTHLFSFRFFLLKLLPLTFLLVTGYIYLINLKWMTFSKQFSFLILLTIILVYVIWLEFYQFYHILNFYNNLSYSYDIGEHSWILDLETRRTRLINHYTSLLLILKFWHIVFIYFFWIFFVLRSMEVKKVKYPLLSANLQNFVILYLFAWVYMYPWLKFYFRKLLDISYYYFYMNPKQNFLKFFFFDFFFVINSVFVEISNVFFFKKLSFLTTNYFYFSSSNFVLNMNNPQNFIKNLIISNL